MSNFFMKSLKEKKNIKSNQISPFDSDNLPKKYKKSIENDKTGNRDKDVQKNKKKFMITPPNENLYRKKNSERPMDFEKSPEYNPISSIINNQNYNRNTIKSNYPNYKTSPHKINYSTQFNCDTDEKNDLQSEKITKKNKKILNTSDIQNVLLNNVSNSPSMFDVIKETADEFDNIQFNTLTENATPKNIPDIGVLNSTILNMNDISNVYPIHTNSYESINNINEKLYVNNIENCKNINDNSKETERHTYINKLNFSSLQKEPTITYIQKDKIKLYNYNVMLDTYTNKFLECKNLNENQLDEQKIPCYYCRRNFNNAPIGLPICYYPSIYIIKNNSQNLKYSFNYKENTVKLNSNEKERLLNILERTSSVSDIVLNNQKKENKKTDKHDGKDSHQIVTKQFFETEGVFCSFNCIVSYLEENRQNPLYQNSYNLIYFMYKIIFGEFPQFTFIKSPSWKLRKEYGGPLSDDDYEKYIQNIPIIDTNQLKCCISKHESVYEVLV